MWHAPFSWETQLTKSSFSGIDLSVSSITQSSPYTDKGDTPGSQLTPPPGQAAQTCDGLTLSAGWVSVLPPWRVGGHVGTRQVREGQIEAGAGRSQAATPAHTSGAGWHLWAFTSYHTCPHPQLRQPGLQGNPSSGMSSVSCRGHKEGPLQEAVTTVGLLPFGQRV